MIISMYNYDCYSNTHPQNVVKSDDCIIYAELGQISKAQRPAVPIEQGVIYSTLCNPDIPPIPKKVIIIIY